MGEDWLVHGFRLNGQRFRFGLEGYLFGLLFGWRLLPRFLSSSRFVRLWASSRQRRRGSRRIDGSRRRGVGSIDFTRYRQSHKYRFVGNPSKSPDCRSRSSEEQTQCCQMSQRADSKRSAPLRTRSRPRQTRGEIGAEFTLVQNEGLVTGRLLQRQGNRIGVIEY